MQSAGQRIRSRLLTLFVVMAFHTGCATNNIVVLVENDGANSNLPARGNYSSGVDIGAASLNPYVYCDKNDGCDPSLKQKVVQFLNFAAYDDGQPGITTWLDWGIGHQFFTPTDISVSTIQKNDRPYAGWLYGRLTIENDRLTGNGYSNWLNDQHNSVSAQLGIVGPSAQASAAQKFFHEEICGCQYPNGWDNQIEDEPGIILTFKREDRLWLHPIGGHWLGDVIGAGEVSIGNVKTQLKAGGQARLGYKLPRFFGSASATTDNMNSNNREFYFYFFAEYFRYLVARDIFLDGNSFRDSPHTVDKETVFGESRIGVEFRTRKLQVRLAYAQRSRQYKTQSDPVSFGSIKVTYSR